MHPRLWEGFALRFTAFAPVIPFYRWSNGVLGQSQGYRKAPLWWLDSLSEEGKLPTDQRGLSRVATSSRKDWTRLVI